MINEYQDLRTRAIAAHHRREVTDAKKWRAIQLSYRDEAYDQLVKVFPMLEKEGHDQCRLCGSLFTVYAMGILANGEKSWALVPVAASDYNFIYDETSLGQYLVSLESRPPMRRERGFWARLFS